MKYFLITLCLGATVLAGCSNSTPTPAVKPTASAAPTAEKPVQAPAPLAAKPPTPAQVSQSLVAKYDVDKDNVVTTEEMLATTLGDLFKASKRNDKTLTSDEFHLALGDKSLKDKDISDTFEKTDTNHDLKVDEKELSAYIWPSILALNQTAQKSAAKSK